MVFVARTGALDESDVLGFLAVARAQDLAAGGAVNVGQALEFDGAATYAYRPSAALAGPFPATGAQGQAFTVCAVSTR